MRTHLRTPLLLLTSLIIALAVVGSALVAVPPIYAHPDPDWIPFHPTAHVEKGGLVGNVINPTHAYDRALAPPYNELRHLQNTTGSWDPDEKWATYAYFTYGTKSAGTFELKTFEIHSYYYNYTDYPIEGNLTFKYTFRAINQSKADEPFRIVYYVDPSPTVTVLIDWTTLGVPLNQSHPTQTYVNASQPEPNDNVWSWTDVASIRFVVEVAAVSGKADEAPFKLYAAWVEVPSPSPPSQTICVQPPSIINHTLTHETPKTIRPMADSAWTGDGLNCTLWTGDYTDWDETVQNGDTDYVKATSYMLIETSQLQDITPDPDWTIARVRVVAYARTNVATDEELVFVLVVGGTKYWADYPAWPMPGYTLTTTYEKYSWDWGKNPDTGNYWTWSDIDALEAGVESKVSTDYVWTGEIRVTQLYVEVEGPRLEVDVEVDGYIYDLWGYTFILDYDTTLLTATSYTFYDPFEYPWPSEINDTAGYVSVSYSKPTGQPGVDTSFPTSSTSLAQIAFLVEGLGATDLDLHTTKLTDSQAGFFSHEVTDGYFENQEAVPEFPFGMVMELSVIVAIVYVWWKRRNKIKIPK